MPARLVEAAGGVDQPEHPVLDQVAQLDGVRHRRGDAARERFHERQAGGDAVTLTGDEGLTLHGLSSRIVRRRHAADGRAGLEAQR